jgi:hypothetical protein
MRDLEVLRIDLKKEASIRLQNDNALQSLLLKTSASLQKAITAGDDAISVSLNTHIANTSNPHSVTKLQVGLGNVDNTNDDSKPVSTAQQTAINKVRDAWYYRRKGVWHTPSMSPIHQSVATSANTIFFVPFIVIDTLTITDIGYNVTTTGTTTLARCGIYSSNSNNEPATVIADSGTLGVSLGAKSITLGSPLVLSGGLYWTAYLQNGTGNVTGCTNLSLPNIFGNSVITATAINVYTKAFAYGALTDVTGLTNASGATPFAYFKVA